MDKIVLIVGVMLTSPARVGGVKYPAGLVEVSAEHLDELVELGVVSEDEAEKAFSQAMNEAEAEAAAAEAAKKTAGAKK